MVAPVLGLRTLAMLARRSPRRTDDIISNLPTVWKMDIRGFVTGDDVSV